MRVIGGALILSAALIGACDRDRSLTRAPPAPSAAAPPAATAPISQPVAPGPSVRTSVVSAASANLREGPSNRARRIASLPRGTEVEVVEFVGAWAKVRTGGNEGYVFARSLRGA
jgi:2',3'-cyclic-nucleotide 2'-phosphodiesterase/3'-nucleotidase